MAQFRRLFAACLTAILIATSAVAAEDAETISWRDLLPVFDETLLLDDNTPWGERVRIDLNDKKVRIPGFIVPVDFGNTQVVTRFLLVPYFGACIHEPPPPPNQTIYAEFEPGYKLESLWDPFWIEGDISVFRVVESLATASYTLRAEKIEPFDG